MSDVTWGYPGGGKVTFHDDGSITIKNDDGSSEHWNAKTGRKTKKKADGTELPPVDPMGGGQPTASGGKKYKYSNGDKIEFGPKPDDTIIYTPPSGTWRRIEYDPKTGTITYTPKTPPTQPKQEKPDTKNGKPYEPPKEGGGSRSGDREKKPRER